MINYEVKVFNDVYATAVLFCAKDRFVSTPIDSYAKLPAAALWELDNTTIRRRMGSSSDETYARITYQLEVVATTKAECRDIYAALDIRMLQLNFVRISGQYVTYPDNQDYVRYVARYEAEVDPDGNLYRPSAW